MLMLERPKLRDGFQGRGFKGSGGRGPQRCDQLMHSSWTLVGMKVKFRASSTFCFQPSRSLFCGQQFLSGGGSASCRNYSEMCIWALSISFRELGVWCFYVVIFQSKLLPVSCPTAVLYFLHFHVS